MSFLSIWERITKETSLKKLNELAEVVETTQPYISRKKKQDHFPVEWAYKVGRKYNLLTEWILTGEGPKRLDDIDTTEEYNFPILKDLDNWLAELVVNEPYRSDWFIGNLEDAFPTFKEWKKRRGSLDGKDNDILGKKFPTKEI